MSPFSFMTRIKSSLLVALLLAFASGSSHAILIDPGAIGGPAGFDGQETQQITGPEAEFDFTFTDMKHVEVGFLEVFLSPNQAVPPNPFLPGTAFWLTDENHREIDGTFTSLTSAANTLDREWDLPITAHDIHFMVLTDRNIFQDIPEFNVSFNIGGVVGEWAVPEPSTAFLLAVGLLGAGFATKRRVH